MMVLLTYTYSTINIDTCIIIGIYHKINTSLEVPIINNNILLVTYSYEFTTNVYIFDLPFHLNIDIKKPLNTQTYTL